MTAHFRLRWKKEGGHVHCRLFAGPARTLTHGRVGLWTMSEEEFDTLRLIVHHSAYADHFEVVPEEEEVPSAIKDTAKTDEV